MEEKTMQLELKGVHHVTAVTGDAARNLDFYSRVLGLRLVKKTVNQDEVSAYHLFYGDETGSPGTELTFFDWPSLIAQRPGAGEVSSTGLRVPSCEALEWWARRLSEEGIAHSGVSEVHSRASLSFSDPEGQRLQIVEDSAPGTPWSGGGVPSEAAILGLGPVKLTLRQLEPTARLLTQVLGFRQISQYALSDAEGASVHVFETGGGGAGGELHVEVRPAAPIARNGRGGVHHVAFRVPDDAQHQQWQEHLERAGLRVTPVIDRF
jgi:glyoxalase family protein